jgi:uncharacterized membrane protein (UPF0127 family)
MIRFAMIRFATLLAASSAFAIRQRARAAAVAWVCLAVSILAMPFPPARSAELQTLEIATKTGVHVFSVELAVTEEEKERGLMFRRSIPEFTGMLFDFENDGPRTMWMKNTYVSLDMIFIQSDGRIRSIAENTEPESEKIIRSRGPVRAVLEVVAGTARKLGIEPGDRVASPTLRH